LWYTTKSRYVLLVVNVNFRKYLEMFLPEGLGRTSTR